MYERMLNKENKPNQEEIISHLGKRAYNLLATLNDRLEERYDIKRELKFPFGNNYGWGYKYNHKSTHLGYVFFEKDAITLLTQLPRVSSIDEFLPKTNQVWADRNPCGNGGWIEYRILNEDELNDVVKLLENKKKPLK